MTNHQLEYEDWEEEYFLRRRNLVAALVLDAHSPDKFLLIAEYAHDLAEAAEMCDSLTTKIG